MLLLIVILPQIEPAVDFLKLRGIAAVPRSDGYHMLQTDGSSAPIYV